MIFLNVEFDVAQNVSWYNILKVHITFFTSDSRLIADLRECVGYLFTLDAAIALFVRSRGQKQSTTSQVWI